MQLHARNWLHGLRFWTILSLLSSGGTFLSLSRRPVDAWEVLLALRKLLYSLPVPRERLPHPRILVWVAKVTRLPNLVLY